MNMFSKAVILSVKCWNMIMVIHWPTKFKRVLTTIEYRQSHISLDRANENCSEWVVQAYITLVTSLDLYRRQVDLLLNFFHLYWKENHAIQSI